MFAVDNFTFERKHIRYFCVDGVKGSIEEEPSNVDSLGTDEDELHLCC